MEKSFSKKEEIYKIVKYQTKLLNSKSQNQQDLYRYKLNEHINNLSKFGLTKDMRQNIMNGGELDISNMDAIFSKINTQRDETLEALKNLNTTGTRVETEFNDDSTTIMGTIETIRSRLEEVNKRLSDTSAELDKCREEASKGDLSSKGQIGKLAEEKNKLQAERDSLMSALEQAMTAQATVREAAVSIKDKAAVPSTLSLKEISNKLTELTKNFNPLLKVELGKSGIESATATETEKSEKEKPEKEKPAEKSATEKSANISMSESTIGSVPNIAKNFEKQQEIKRR
jgi:hypothetical protein